MTMLSVSGGRSLKRSLVAVVIVSVCLGLGPGGEGSRWHMPSYWENPLLPHSSQARSIRLIVEISPPIPSFLD